MAWERAAGDPIFHELVQRQVAQLSTQGWYHSIELPGGNVIQGMIGIEALKARLAGFPIPADLAGKRVLDVGAWTGWCSFEMERRGAQVTAVDCVEFEEFRQAHRMLGSRVDYRILDVDELSPATVGLFDYVLFFGVLYHLRNPLLGLEKICALTTDTAFVESFVTDDGGGGSTGCTLEFYETDELGGQIDNWFGPSVQCAQALCRSAGFARVNLEYVSERRAGLTCRRRWEPPPQRPGEAAPLLYSAVNNRTNDVQFHAGKDEYICVYFKSGVPELTRDRLRIEVDGYGAPVLVLAHQRAEEWQANLRLPPGLAAGAHQVRLRTADSDYSNTFSIAVDGGQPDAAPRPTAPLPATAGPPAEIYEVSNGLTGSAVFYGHRNEYVCCRFRTPEAPLDRDSVTLRIDDAEQPVLFLTNLGDGCWQANSGLPAGLTGGQHRVRVRTRGGVFGSAAEITFQRAGG